MLVIDDGFNNKLINNIEYWLKQPRKQKYEVIKKRINGGRKGYALDYALDLGIANGDVYIIVDRIHLLNQMALKR